MKVIIKKSAETFRTEISAICQSAHYEISRRISKASIPYYIEAKTQMTKKGNLTLTMKVDDKKMRVFDSEGKEKVGFGFENTTTMDRSLITGRSAHVGWKHYGAGIANTIQGKLIREGYFPSKAGWEINGR